MLCNDNEMVQSVDFRQCKQHGTVDCPLPCAWNQTSWVALVTNKYCTNIVSFFVVFKQKSNRCEKNKEQCHTGFNVYESKADKEMEKENSHTPYEARENSLFPSDWLSQTSVTIVTSLDTVFVTQTVDHSINILVCFKRECQYWSLTGRSTSTN